MAFPRIGIVSLSSPIGPVELERGLARLRKSNFEFVVHPNALARSFVTAGTDEQRTQSLLDYAFDDAIDVIWCARGGYGAARVLSKLDAVTSAVGKPNKKLLVGYSDVTVLHEYVRNAWGWETLHAPMITAGPSPTKEHWAAVDAIVRGEPSHCAYEAPCLDWMENPPSGEIHGDVIGGNLSLWSSLAGTPWQPRSPGKILFFEDIGEKLYRLDRMVVQLEQSGMFAGAAAIVLGDFTDCDDETPTMFGDDGQSRVPMRPVLSLSAGLDEIFGRVARKYGIPLAKNLPVGHGPNFWPLRLGVEHRLTSDGRLIPNGV